MNHRLLSLKLWIVGGLAYLMALSGALASTSSGITYHGRLVDPFGHAVNGSNVQFRVQLRTPGSENCLMYDEVQTKDLSQSDGVFSITINDGTGTRLDSSGYSLDQIFANRGSFTFAGGQCASGNTYNTSPSDGRKIQVLFNDGTIGAGQWEPVPPVSINFVPMAIEAMQVGGYKKEQLVRVADGVSTTQTEISSGDWTKFLALIAGTSTQYVKPGDQVTQLKGADLPSSMGNGESFRWNTSLNSGSGGWESFTAGSASAVTQVTAGTGLNVGAGPGGNITSTGTLNVNVGTGANQIVQLNGSSQLPAVDGSALTGVNASKVGGTAVSLAALSNGQVLKYNGTNWVNAADADTLGGMSCGNGQVAYYNSGWGCLTVTSANTINTIMTRDGSGNFVAGMGTFNTGIKITDGAAGGQITMAA
ncbi:MAG: hypothetical protein COT73_08835, partial [Bdellovibrio sp. CG10_big_fil_rev_8_21_14_0_10_47_8]